MLLECRTDAVAAVVVMLRVTVAEGAAAVRLTDAGREQTGGGALCGLTLQDKFTVPVKPPVPFTVIAELAEPPGETV
jgi:hypothetical protein